MIDARRDGALVEAMADAIWRALAAPSGDAQDAARSALAVVREAEGWQSVDDAPHGVDVLLYSPPTEYARAAYEVQPFSTGERIGRYSSISHHSWATHWRPLPAPPEDAA